LRTLRVTPYFEPAWCWGGPAVSIPTACRALVRAGTSVTVFTTTAGLAPEQGIDPEREYDLDGVKVCYFPHRWPLRYFRSPALTRALSACAAGFDLMHLHGVFCHTNLAAWRVAKRSHIPYVVTVHGVLDPVVLGQGLVKRHKKAAYIALIERRVINGASRIIALSEAERTQIQGLGFRPAVAVIPNGLEPSKLAPVPERARVDAHWPALAGRPYVLHLGRLHPKKGIPLLIEAFGTLVRQEPEWRLVLAGPDENGHQRELEAQVQRAGLGPVTLFPGLVSGEPKLALLGNADVFCLASHSEGVPTAVLEALFCRRPVLIAEGCYLPQVGQQGAGLVVPASVEALAEGLVNLARAGEARRDMGERARALAQREFGVDTHAQRTQRLYAEILDERRASRPG